ncbi:MAG: ABC transporter ATP-binding protein [Acidobacteria bacterium RBG_16_64_8]|nr:MAG: ABC transporter ATP-binding protein [Acidobacteria bacterium RBG_16_64_8]
MLEVKELSVSYGDVRALHDVSLQVEEGSIVALVGVNGAGKTTLLKTVSGLLHPLGGQILFMGEDLGKLNPKHRVDKGIVMVPEGRRLFQTLTILENLRLGAYLPRARASYNESLERVFGLFPVLKERKDGKAGLLSGGEQQMLAIGRAVMAHPKLIMIDEASLGLSPILTRKIFELIVALNQQETTVLMVEQNIHMALKVCNKAYVMKTGSIVLSGSGQELLANVDVRKAYIGERGSKL